MDFVMFVLMFILFVPTGVASAMFGASVGMYYSDRFVKYLKSKDEK